MFDQSVLKSRLLLAILLVAVVFLVLYFGDISEKYCRIQIPTFGSV